MDKHDIRKLYLQRRRQLNDVERNRADDEICRLLSRLPELQHYSRIAAFVSDGSEPDLMPLLQQLAENGYRILLPRFSADSNAQYEMVDTPLTPGSLQTGKYGIAEPVATLPAADDELNDALWLLPGVAFDENGNRLGRGKGIYDRLLTQAQAPAVGIFYECQKTVNLPTDGHDYRLDIIITEAGIIRIKNGDKKWKI